MEAQRLEQRTNFDLEMMLAAGTCPGIENYSRYLSGRNPGEPPPTLFEYLPDDALVFTDESHITVSQIGAMYKGDFRRKSTLAEYGFRLPAAMDNRPLKFEEFESLQNEIIYVSATPADYELEMCEGVITEQIIRPTGLLDPKIKIKPTKHQIDDLIDDAIQRFHERHGEGIDRVFLKHKITQAEKDIMVGTASTTTATSTFGGITSIDYTEGANYLPLPDSVIAVQKVFKMDSSTISAGMFNLKYQIFLNDLYYYGAIDLLNYGMVKSYLETLDYMLNPDVQIRFNKRIIDYT